MRIVTTLMSCQDARIARFSSDLQNLGSSCKQTIVQIAVQKEIIIYLSIEDEDDLNKGSITGLDNFATYILSVECKTQTTFIGYSGTPIILEFMKGNETDLWT